MMIGQVISAGVLLLVSYFTICMLGNKVGDRGERTKLRDFVGCSLIMGIVSKVFVGLVTAFVFISFPSCFVL